MYGVFYRGILSNGILLHPKLMNLELIAMLEEWDRIPQRITRSLIRSFSRRYRAVIQESGGHTKY
jgi:hypothetical protein